MPDYRLIRDASLIPCEQCHNKAGTEPHACANQQPWPQKEQVLCNCCADCQDHCRQAKSVAL